jgi:hypothetical protein
MKDLTMSMAKWLVIIISVSLGAGCAGLSTFSQSVYSGQTVAIPVGWQPDWSRDNITVSVKEFGASGWIDYPVNSASIRAVVNLYPDPLSSMVVSNRTGQNVTSYAESYGNNVTNVFTSHSRDWFETVVFFDLPDPMALGVAQISVDEVANPGNYVTVTVDIIGTGEVADDLEAEFAGPLQRLHLASLERASHYTVTLSGTGDVPHAVQLDFTHDPDMDHGGGPDAGKAYVVEPISGVKNISWTDDGTKLRVVILPADGNTPASFEDFRFYVAGGIKNLAPDVAPGSTQAFNINGGNVTGVSTPTVTPHDIAIAEN